MIHSSPAYAALSVKVERCFLMTEVERKSDIPNVRAFSKKHAEDLIHCCKLILDQVLAC